MIEQQTILAIETSTTACSAALLIQSQSAPEINAPVHVIYESWQNAPRQHTDLILPMLDDVLEQANCSLSDVDALAFGCGPGAFTGVRIATSVIQAISYATKLKVVSISSLAALAQCALRKNTKLLYPRKNNCKNIIVANDARMNEIYIGCYQNNGSNTQLIGEEKLLKPENIGDFIQDYCNKYPQWLAVGNGWSEYKELIEPQLINFPYVNIITDNLPHAQDIALLAIDKLANGEYGDAQTALPVYLRNNVAEKSVTKKVVAAKVDSLREK